MSGLGIGGVLHGRAEALVADGGSVTAAKEEPFAGRERGKARVPFAMRDLPEPTARGCLADAGLDARDPDANARSRRAYRAPRAVLLDRDGTLIADVPRNRHPDTVEPVPGAREALRLLRQAGVSLAVVSNQPALGRGELSLSEFAAVNRRIVQLLGPLGAWFVCLHQPDEPCGCRKPASGLVAAAARALGVRPDECTVIGDVGVDVEAALAAGARPILVPTACTRAEDIRAAPVVAPDLLTAVELLLGGRTGSP